MIGWVKRLVTLFLDDDEKDASSASMPCTATTTHLSSSTVTATTTTTMMMMLIVTIVTCLQKCLRNINTHHRLSVLLRCQLPYEIAIYLFLEFCKMIQSTAEEINDTYLQQQQQQQQQYNHADLEDTDDENDNRPSSSSSSSSQSQSYSSSSQATAYRHCPQVVQQRVRYLHQQQKESSPSSSFVTENIKKNPILLCNNINSTTVATTSYLSIYTLAQWLHSAGIPYCSNKNRNPSMVDHFGGQTTAQGGNSLCIADDNHNINNNNNIKTDRPFLLALFDQNHHHLDHNDNYHHPNEDPWKTIFGSFYNIGTLEIGLFTLDVFLQYIRQVLQSSESDDHNDIRNSDNIKSNNNKNNGDSTNQASRFGYDRYLSKKEHADLEENDDDRPSSSSSSQQSYSSSSRAAAQRHGPHIAQEIVQQLHQQQSSSASASTSSAKNVVELFWNRRPPPHWKQQQQQQQNHDRLGQKTKSVPGLEMMNEMRMIPHHSPLQQYLRPTNPRIAK